MQVKCHVTLKGYDLRGHYQKHSLSVGVVINVAKRGAMYHNSGGDECD
jgi:hypothetical protein